MTAPSPTTAHSAWLNPGEDAPLYHQLKEALLAQIRSGELMPGMSIPSERTLMATYSVSRSTVREAVQALVHAGFLRTSQRRGTFVVEPKLEQDLAHFYSFSAQM